MTLPSTLDKHDELCVRTKQFALRVIRLFRSLPRTKAEILGVQLLRSATSVAANYRASGRSRSRAEFVAKIGVVCEEADESLFWLELLQDAEFLKRNRLEPLVEEARQLVAIFTAARHTARSRR